MPSLLSAPGAPHSPLRTSRLLHERVRRFAELATDPPLVRPADADDFDTLALDIAHFQATECPGYARLLDGAEQLAPGELDRLPAVPAEAFRLARVAAHPSDLDSYVFQSSGTTADQSARHAVRDIGTYETLALCLGRQTLFRHLDRAVVVALAPPPGPKITSSLTFMMALYMREFDGRALTASPSGAPFSPFAFERWLFTSGQPDPTALERAARVARARHEPLVLLSTSFALASLLEGLDEEELDLPKGSLVMLTGGFKGRKTELDESALRRAAARTFRIPAAAILAEYGMTELTSQLYEAWSGPSRDLPARDASALARRPTWWPEGGEPGRYHCPPWLRVSVVDPVTHARLPDGQVGVARFIDLGNVDSALCVVTEDLARTTEAGLELLGRRPGAEARGCSLPFEGLLRGPGRTLW